MQTFQNSSEQRLLGDIRGDIFDLVVDAFRREGYDPSLLSDVRLLELINEKAASVRDRITAVIAQDLQAYRTAIERALEAALSQ